MHVGQHELAKQTLQTAVDSISASVSGEDKFCRSLRENLKDATNVLNSSTSSKDSCSFMTAMYVYTNKKSHYYYATNCSRICSTLLDYN